MSRLNPSPLIGVDRKKPQVYKGLLVKTDTNLHEQLSVWIEQKIKILDIQNNQSRKPCVLDWGCGEGAFSQRLHDIGCDVVAVDIDATNFKAQGPAFYKLDFNNYLEIEEFIHKYYQSFDLIVAIEVIEHVKNPWEFIQRLYQLCNPNTHVIVTTPNISSWWSRFWFLLTGELWGFMQECWVDPGHINPIGDIEMKNMLREIGFECLDVWPGGNLPVIWLYNWKRTLVSLCMFPIYLIMKGQKQGYSLCYHAVPRR